MGRDGVNVNRPTSLMDVFTEACPHYMSFGMSYEAYWDGPTDAHRMYREAQQLRIEAQNTRAWLQGRYFYDALCAVSPILRAFSKARRPSPYSEEPYDLFEDQKRRRAEREEKERYDRVRRNVEAFAKAFNEARKTPEGKEDVNGSDNDRAGVQHHGEHRRSPELDRETDERPE